MCGQSLLIRGDWHFNMTDVNSKRFLACRIFASGSMNRDLFFAGGTVEDGNIVTLKSANPLEGEKERLTEFIINPKNVTLKIFQALTLHFNL